MPNQN
jgi:hypothetical protein